MTAKTLPDGNASGSAFAAVDRVYSKLENFLNGISALTIFMVMIIGVTQVFGRKLINAPIPGYIDYIEQSMIIFAFFGIAYCQRLGGHVRMDLFMARFNGRLLYFFEALATLVGLVVITILIDTSWLHFMRAYEYGDSTIDISLPIWPAKLVIPLAFGVLWVRFLLQFIGFIRLFFYPNAEVIAVPVIEDVTVQARNEIEDALGEEAARDAKFDETYGKKGKK
ncbi:MAG: C4-dicarboxylate ABC transporter substrate-binding protein [Sneathiella sp.]|jgi:TRAP-type C4-dicarboxylate transport system permease small subunit|uniref:TRAP transporter small permease n=1 Tax=Sneathiella sp. TaxID=1964365 RepID=UPI000C41A720|nr:TRAP transporter small permease [Sneathiella sp.]MAL78486.1 C4-dicarboxylate ABC transporter substrate-binding protein [Sneathiella sp.]|tara:strand:- start:86 stop:754 length:669 start_codon:yes stop_codon:yes gene_type:complete